MSTFRITSDVVEGVVESFMRALSNWEVVIDDPTSKRIVVWFRRKPYGR